MFALSLAAHADPIPGVPLTNISVSPLPFSGWGTEKKRGTGWVDIQASTLGSGFLAP